MEAKDLAPAQWKAKFEATKVKEDGKTPCYGEISRVANLQPRVAHETLRRRYLEGQAGVLKSGAQPALGCLEKDLYVWLKIYKSLGVNIYERTVREKATGQVKAAGIKWDFKASKSWLDGFLRRHELNLRHGQFLEAVCRRVVSPEALNWFFDN